MNFQQLRYVRAAVRNDLNLTKAASELFTSQSGVSKQIRELEIELQIEIFVRRGKRLVGLTPAGESAAELIDRLLQDADNLKRLSAQFAQADKGRLIIAATHNQANYVLPAVLVRFARLFPYVEVELRQGNPSYVVDMLVRGDADIGIATEAIDGHPHLETFPCFTWRHVAIVTYSPEFTGGSQIQDGFEQAGLEADIRLSAMDADVIKTYVRLGAGVGIIAQMAMENGTPTELVAVPGSKQFFGECSTKIAVQRNMLLRNYAYSLIEMLAPHLEGELSRGAKRSASSGTASGIRDFAERPDLMFGPGVKDRIG